MIAIDYGLYVYILLAPSEINEIETPIPQVYCESNFSCSNLYQTIIIKFVPWDKRVKFRQMIT